MKNKEFMDNFTAIVKKVDNVMDSAMGEIYIISDDPNCDSDYGVDEEGNLVIDGRISCLKIADLRNIRYRAGAYPEICFQNDYYISLIFDNDITLYLYINDCGIGDAKGIRIGGYFSDCNTVVRGIIYNRGYNWNDKLVIKDNELVAYIGNDKEVVIPEGIISIGEAAFRNSGVERVILASTTTDIEKYAFKMSRLRYIELKNVERIGEDAFLHCMLNSIVLPESLKEISDKAFYFTKLTIDSIENYSGVTMDDRVLKPWQA